MIPQQFLKLEHTGMLYEQRLYEQMMIPHKHFNLEYGSMVFDRYLHDHW